MDEWFKTANIGDSIDISDEINKDIDFINDNKAYEKVGERLGSLIMEIQGEI